jgi:hypothetical protein
MQVVKGSAAAISHKAAKQRGTNRELGASPDPETRTQKTLMSNKTNTHHKT